MCKLSWGWRQSDKMYIWSWCSFSATLEPFLMCRSTFSSKTSTGNTFLRFVSRYNNFTQGLSRLLQEETPSNEGLCCLSEVRLNWTLKLLALSCRVAVANLTERKTLKLFVLASKSVRNVFPASVPLENELQNFRNGSVVAENELAKVGRISEKSMKSNISDKKSNGFWWYCVHLLKYTVDSNNYLHSRFFWGDHLELCDCAETWQKWTLRVPEYFYKVSDQTRTSNPSYHRFSDGDPLFEKSKSSCNFLILSVRSTSKFQSSQWWEWEWWSWNPIFGSRLWCEGSVYIYYDRYGDKQCWTLMF